MKFEMLCRIDKSSFSPESQKYYTIVSTPAPDEFSNPSSFRLVSSSSLGNPEDRIKATISISGYVRSKRYKDKNTGELKDFSDCNTYLSVVSFTPEDHNFKKAS